MFGWERAAALWASRLKRSTNSSSLGVARAHDLQGDVAVEDVVVGEEDVGHAAAAERLDQAVAVVYELLH